MFLMGPVKQLKRMCDKTRALATIIMIVSAQTNSWFFFSSWFQTTDTQETSKHLQGKSYNKWYRKPWPWKYDDMNQDIKLSTLCSRDFCSLFNNNGSWLILILQFSFCGRWKRNICCNMWQNKKVNHKDKAQKCGLTLILIQKESIKSFNRFQHLFQWINAWLS